jgi:hypothetical protein
MKQYPNSDVFWDIVMLQVRNVVKTMLGGQHSAGPTPAVWMRPFELGWRKNSKGHGISSSQQHPIMNDIARSNPGVYHFFEHDRSSGECWLKWIPASNF